MDCCGRWRCTLGSRSKGGPIQVDGPPIEPFALPARGARLGVGKLVRSAAALRYGAAHWTTVLPAWVSAIDAALTCRVRRFPCARRSHPQRLPGLMLMRISWFVPLEPTRTRPAMHRRGPKTPEVTRRYRHFRATCGDLRGPASDVSSRTCARSNTPQVLLRSANHWISNDHHDRH